MSKNEGVPLIKEEAEAVPGELVVGHALGYARNLKRFDGGELVIGVSMNIIPKIIDGELTIRPLHSLK